MPSPVNPTLSRHLTVDLQLWVMLSAASQVIYSFILSPSRHWGPNAMLSECFEEWGCTRSLEDFISKSSCKKLQNDQPKEDECGVNWIIHSLRRRRSSAAEVMDKYVIRYKDPADLPADHQPLLRYSVLLSPTRTNKWGSCSLSLPLLYSIEFWSQRSSWLRT